jgi:hypothetical protein
MCVCIYVCMYVCLYVCVYIFMYICMYVCMYVCACVCMYVCMYVCACVYVCVCVKHLATCEDSPTLCSATGFARTYFIGSKITSRLTKFVNMPAVLQCSYILLLLLLPLNTRCWCAGSLPPQAFERSIGYRPINQNCGIHQNFRALKVQSIK